MTNKGFVAVILCCAELPAAAAKPLPRLHWTGAATIHAGERVVQILVDTEVAPFSTATSRSRLISEDPGRTRMMTITPTAGEVSFQGATRTLSDTQAEHERQQFALYGLLLTTHAKGRCVSVERPSAPTTRLCFDRLGMVRSGSNVVPDPETGSPISQSFEFRGKLQSGKTVWPQRIMIYQEGRLYFDLTIKTFAASNP